MVTTRQRRKQAPKKNAAALGVWKPAPQKLKCTVKDRQTGFKLEELLEQMHKMSHDIEVATRKAAEMENALKRQTLIIQNMHLDRTKNKNELKKFRVLHNAAELNRIEQEKRIQELKATLKTFGNKVSETNPERLMRIVKCGAGYFTSLAVAHIFRQLTTYYISPHLAQIGALTAITTVSKVIPQWYKGRANAGPVSNVKLVNPEQLNTWT